MKSRSIPMILSIALVTVLCGSVCSAQEDSGPPKPPPTFIELTSIQIKKVKEAWNLRLVGKAPLLPAKTVIGFEIRWRSLPRAPRVEWLWKAAGLQNWLQPDKNRYSRSMRSSMHLITSFCQA